MRKMRYRNIQKTVRERVIDEVICDYCGRTITSNFFTVHYYDCYDDYSTDKDYCDLTCAQEDINTFYISRSGDKTAEIGYEHYAIPDETSF